ncbi:MAG: hypothetical protein CBC34_017205 [Hyphomicrobiaceae bacterium TMED74]|nr:hypothetical protein [Filomicrobium sp.]RPG37832.1 MAG: hypothetical protein CBC34_017205 [Hyphomicrobiaceae bacterium TMED74]
MGVIAADGPLILASDECHLGDAGLDRERLVRPVAVGTDQAIGLATRNSEAMVARLIEIADSDLGHVSVKAAESVVKLGQEQTAIERDPFGLTELSDLGNFDEEDNS